MTLGGKFIKFWLHDQIVHDGEVYVYIRVERVYGVDERSRETDIGATARLILFLSKQSCQTEP